MCDDPQGLSDVGQPDGARGIQEAARRDLAGIGVRSLGARAHNYSIYLDRKRSLLFGYVEVESVESWDAIATTETCRRWWGHTREIMYSNPDGSPVSEDLEEPTIWPDARVIGHNIIKPSRCAGPFHATTASTVTSAWTTASAKGFGRRPFATVGLGPGPALDSLPRRKPRGGRGSVWRARLWGFEDRGRLASEALAAGGAWCLRRKRRRWPFSMATMRGSEALASVAGGLATSRGRRAHVPARGWRRRRSTVRRDAGRRS